MRRSLRPLFADRGVTFPDGRGGKKRPKSIALSPVLMPVDSAASEVLGYRRTSGGGRSLWRELDWSRWYVDGPAAHIFNPAGGLYLHVRVKYSPAEDGPTPPRNPDHVRWYRVRCFYAGRKLRGLVATTVGIAAKDGALHWIVGFGEPCARPARRA